MLRCITNFGNGALAMLKVLILAAAALAMTSMAEAQTYPVKPIKLVVPFPAGGATDTTARLVAQRLQLGLGQSVIIENQGGAGGTIAAKQVATPPPSPPASSARLLPR